MFSTNIDKCVHCSSRINYSVVWKCLRICPDHPVSIKKKKCTSLLIDRNGNLSGTWIPWPYRLTRVTCVLLCLLRIYTYYTPTAAYGIITQLNVEINSQKWSFSRYEYVDILRRKQRSYNIIIMLVTFLMNFTKIFSKKKPLYQYATIIL